MLVARLMTIASLVVAVWPSSAAAAAAPVTATTSVIGDAWLLEINHQEAQQSANGSSSGSSSGHDAIVERVVAIAPDGVTYEYDLPPNATADDRSRQWQFPVRLFRSTSGAVQIIDVAALDRRIDIWLAWGGMSRADCGRWFFTWNAFHIDCDAHSVVATVEPFLLPREPMNETVLATHQNARAGGSYARAADGSYRATLAIDPETVRHGKAEAAVVIGGIDNQPVTTEAATATWARAAINGTIAIQLDTAADGRARRRVTQTTIVIAGMGDEDGQVTATETLTRTPLPPPPPSGAGV